MWLNIYRIQKMKTAPYHILYEDSSVIVVYKERDVFTIHTKDKKTFHHNLYFYLSCYLRKKNEELHIVHRLDYETSGILIFAKDVETKKRLQDCFLKRNVKRLYEAVVRENVPLFFEKEVRMYLSDGKNGTLVSETSMEEGKEAITLLKASNDIQIGTAMAVEIKTGRRNQIRLALKKEGFTLIGDKRYAHDEAKRMYLNCYYLSFPPEAGLKVNTFFTAPLWLKEGAIVSGKAESDIGG